MSSDFTVVIAAAGIGSRLGMNLPKSLVEINGRTVLERLLTECLHDIDDVRLVVGFRGDEVMSHARAIRNDIVFVRNPAFRDTSVRHSFWLAARHINRPCIFIDGDMLIEPESFRQFLKASRHEETLIGIAQATSEDAVYVQLDEENQVTRFTRTRSSDHEWCGIAKLPSRIFNIKNQYMFECIEELLPSPSFKLKTAEIDTPQDLERAIFFARSLGERSNILTRSNQSS